MNAMGSANRMDTTGEAVGAVGTSGAPRSVRPFGGAAAIST
jgi:hypothetical protein